MSTHTDTQSFQEWMDGVFDEGRKTKVGGQLSFVFRQVRMAYT